MITFEDIEVMDADELEEGRSSRKERRFTSRNVDEATESRKVFTYFRLAESFVCGVCLLIHVAGFYNRHEPVGHATIFCGSFIGLFVAHFIELVAVVSHSWQPLITNVFISAVATLMFLGDALVTLATTEEDVHLQFMQGKEEENHEAFVWNIRQAVAILFGYFLYLMDTILSLELYIQRKTVPVEEECAYPKQIENDDPLRLVFFCQNIYKGVLRTLHFLYITYICQTCCFACCYVTCRFVHLVRCTKWMPCCKYCVEEEEVPVKTPRLTEAIHRKMSTFAKRKSVQADKPYEDIYITRMSASSERPTETRASRASRHSSAARKQNVAASGSKSSDRKRAKTVRMSVWSAETELPPGKETLAKEKLVATRLDEINPDERMSRYNRTGRPHHDTPVDVERKTRLHGSTIFEIEPEEEPKPDSRFRNLMCRRCSRPQRDDSDDDEEPDDIEVARARKYDD